MSDNVDSTVVALMILSEERKHWECERRSEEFEEYDELPVLMGAVERRRSQ